MTTSPGEENSGPSRTRKTRPQTACEFCRRRKIGCDGAQRPGKQCSNCAACNVDCKYSDSRRVLAPSKSYIQELEKKLERMENIMRRILPETHVGGLSTAEIEDRLRQEDYERDAMDNSLTQAKLGYIYHGKSSTAQFIQTARVFKQGHTGEISDRVTLRRSEFWDAPPWHQNTWFQSYYPDYTFPEDDLLSSLVDLYFVEVNIFVPLLHRPTFEKLVNDKFYLENKEFATVLLYVCALASRYTDDPRVLSDGVSSKQSNGWKWIDQVIRARKSLISVPTLHSLQCICLFAQFMLGSSAPHLCWTIASIGLRSSLEAGLHRRKVNYANPTIESELWKRAFWTLVYIDRQSSAFLGRSCCLFDEEIDLDLPIECDDEYWEPPNVANAFRQPLGRPALVSYFNCYLKLTSSITTCLRTIYAIERSLIRRVSLDLDKNWQKRMIEQLNARLKLWMDAMPDHLRWDSDRKDPIHLAQSASLNLQYHHLRMLIYRPFISMPYDSEKFPFHSVTICTNAARVCADIIETQLRRKGHLGPYYGLAAFNAAAVLLFDYWHTKRGLPVNPADLKPVDACMKILQVLETRWQIAGRLWDVLHELVSVGDLHPNSANPESEMSVDNSSIYTPNEDFPDSLSKILLGGNTFHDVPVMDESSWFSNIELPLVPSDEVNIQPQISVASSENVGLGPSHFPPRGEGYVNGIETLQKFGFTIDNQDSFLEPSCFFNKSAGTSTPDNTLPTTNEPHNIRRNEMNLDDWGSFFSNVDELTHGVWQFENSNDSATTNSGLW